MGFVWRKPTFHYHTRLLNQNLTPMAEQVSRLVIIHEEGEAGHEMPDLSRPVQAVSKAVHNLVKVGHEMVESTNDAVLRQDMPQALQKVENAASLLEEAAVASQIDPLSGPARHKLIQGSRWILQGTSNVLMAFDESEVRKIICDCKKVLDYLAVAEVIESMEDLVQFVKDLSPCLSKVRKEVERRIDDLTHQVHREILGRCKDQMQILAPILVCSMKIFIQIITQAGGEGRGDDAAAENRNYLANRMIEEVTEIIRVLQLTTYDEDEWNSDTLTVMRKIQNVIDSKMQQAHDWLQNPESLQGGVGEKSVRQILEQALKLSDRSLPIDAEHIRKLSDDIHSMTGALCELRSVGEGISPQAETLARGVEARLNELLQTINQAVSRVEKSGIQQPSPTVSGRLEQARRWLEQPGVDDRGLGQQAIGLVLEDGYKIAGVLPSPHGDHAVALCKSIKQNTVELAELCRRGQGNSRRAIELSRSVATNLGELKDAIETALVDKVIDDFRDVLTPLKQFADVVVREKPKSQPEMAERDNLFMEKAGQLSKFSDGCVRTAKMVAIGTNTGNKKVAEALLLSSAHVESLTPQFINAGRIRMVYPENKAADDHFENLKSQFAECAQRMRALCDVATDSKAFIERSLIAMQEAVDGCEDAIKMAHPIKMVEHTTNLARLCNRVLQVAKQEADNSEDAAFNTRVDLAMERMQSNMVPVVQSAKSLAKNITHPGMIADWRRNYMLLLESIQGVHKAVSSSPQEVPPLPPYPNMADLSITDQNAPPRPPLPTELDGGQFGGVCAKASGRHQQHLDTTTDDESEDVFQNAPTPSQGPIMMAAHDLHQEVKQWSSKDNDIIAAAKKMALLMAKLSHLVQEDSGSKKELIACSKAIAEASEDVTRIAKELAKECTDKRMRTSLLQVCERIPTIATQLKILSTVKATMLGAQGTEEDDEATEMLVGNAQNLMQSVKQTVTAAEAATIKIRTNAGICLRWHRKQPWYQY